MTVVGVVATVTAGEYVECEGQWHQDKQHGLQFKAQTLTVIPPSTLAGIEKYLGSGMVRGIGPFFAKRLVKAFGESVFDVIEQDPKRLLTLAGIGRKRYESIVKAWAEQKTIRAIMVFLQSHGVGTSRAVRIFKTYGHDAIEVIRENPYCLVTSIRGIGFKTADQLAARLGIPSDSILRAQAGLIHTLQTMTDDGHCACERTTLLDQAQTLLEIPRSILEAALENECREHRLRAVEIKGKVCLYPMSLYHAEVQVAELLTGLAHGTPAWGTMVADLAIPWAEKRSGRTLSPSQRAGLGTLLTTKLAILTGGPGVGKTTVIHTFLQIIQTRRLRIGLCAPTGRAAKRLSESTGCDAKTIHRLLQIDPRTGQFQHHAQYPLSVDVLIIDEVSMLDVVLMYHLLKAIPPKASVLFVGDQDQLPSVGPGQVLSDMMASGCIPTVRLTEIFRQAATSRIIQNAHRINHGRLPLPNDPAGDFFTVYTPTVEEAYDQLMEIVTHRLPAHYGCDPIEDIQVLTPMNRGGLGTTALNSALQGALNPDAQPRLTKYGTTYAPGDKVIQLSNNYDKDIYNGDVGRIVAIDVHDGTLDLDLNGRRVRYDVSDLDELGLAYATSIHKSQGSEYPIVVMPVVMQHYRLLARHLLYTGITRGKQRVIVIGQKKAIALAVKNVNTQTRLTDLTTRLRGLMGTQDRQVDALT